MKLKNTLVAATLSLFITSAHAGFVHTDWKAEGDNAATLHEDTGIEWLKLTNTFMMSIEQVSSNAEFDGWRLPTPTEVNTLMNSILGLDFVVGEKTYRAPTSGNKQAWAGPAWNPLLGAIRDGNYYSTGAHLDGNDELTSTGVVYQSSFGNSTIIHDYEPYPDGKERHYRGVFLVSDGGTTLSSRQNPNINANNANSPVANVSAPALLGLMSLGLFGFAVRRRLSGAMPNK
jgi:hypothetical protein